MGNPLQLFLLAKRLPAISPLAVGFGLVYFTFNIGPWYEFFFPAQIFNWMSINQKQQINQLNIDISIQLALHGHFFLFHHQETLDGKKIHCKELVNKGWWCWVSIAVHPLVNYIISQTMSSYGDHHDYDDEEEFIWLWRIWYQNTNSLFSMILDGAECWWCLNQNEALAILVQAIRLQLFEVF